MADAVNFLELGLNHLNRKKLVQRWQPAVTVTANERHQNAISYPPSSPNLRSNLAIITASDALLLGVRQLATGNIHQGPSPQTRTW